MLNQHVFLKMYRNCLVSWKYMHYLFMSQVEISTTNSVNKRRNVIERCHITFYSFYFT